MATKRPVPTTACAHHWVLPPPGGPKSQGVCKHCGAQREFSNTAGSGWVVRSGNKR